MPTIDDTRTIAASTPPVHLGRPPTRLDASGAPASDDAPVRIRIATTTADLERAAAIRYQAHTHRGSSWAHVLARPEAADVDDGVTVLLAEAAHDATPLGTMRIHLRDRHPLPLEASVRLPSPLCNCRLAEAERLAVLPSTPLARDARNALFRACWQHVRLHDVEWLVATAVSPVDRIYEGLLFEDVFAPGTWLPMRHAGDLPHRVMAVQIDRAPAAWAQRGHPLLGYMLRGDAVSDVAKPAYA
jgi:hypothetical protein